MWRTSRTAVFALAAVVAASFAACGGGRAATDRSRTIVVFTRTLGLRHSSIPAALAATRDLA